MVIIYVTSVLSVTHELAIYPCINFNLMHTWSQQAVVTSLLKIEPQILLTRQYLHNKLEGANLGSLLLKIKIHLLA
jgi:hypothetical protein